MRYEWEPTDFYHSENNSDRRMAFGMIVHKPSGKNERWLLGWVEEDNHHDPRPDRKRCIQVSLLDGMMLGPMSAIDMADTLNRSNMIPIMQPVSANDAFQNIIRSQLEPKKLVGLIG